MPVERTLFRGPTRVTQADTELDRATQSSRLVACEKALATFRLNVPREVNVQTPVKEKSKRKSDNTAAGRREYIAQLDAEEMQLDAEAKGLKKQQRWEWIKTMKVASWIPDYMATMDTSDSD